MTPRVAILMETSLEVSRNMLRGIIRYIREHGTWTLDLTPGGIADQRLPDNWNGRDFRPSYWRITHRAYADITGSVKFWKVLRISVRERYQFSHNSCKEIDETEWRYTKESYYDPEKGPYYVYELKDGYPLVDPKIKEATDDHV